MTNINANILFLLSSIGIYERGISWYSLEQQFIRWDCKSAKTEKGKFYEFIEKGDLVDFNESQLQGFPIMKINFKGKRYLQDANIDILKIRSRVYSMEDVKNELLQLESLLFSVTYI